MSGTAGAAGSEASRREGDEAEGEKALEGPSYHLGQGAADGGGRNRQHADRLEDGLNGARGEVRASLLAHGGADSESVEKGFNGAGGDPEEQIHCTVSNFDIGFITVGASSRLGLVSQ